MDEPLFDASSEPGAKRLRETASNESSTVRPFLGIRFECCKTYGRIYRNDARTAYSGQCPRCFAKIKVPIGNDGTSSRFFTAQ